MTQDEYKLKLLELEREKSIATQQQSPATDTPSTDTPPDNKMSRINSLYGDRIKSYSDKYGVDPKATAAIIHAESNANADSTSQNPNSSARGLGQFIRSTGKSLGITNPDDASQSIEATAKLLRQNLDRYGSYDKALAAHHEGSHAMDAIVNKADTEGSDFKKYLSPEAQAEMPRFANAYKMLGGTDSSLSAIQTPPPQTLSQPNPNGDRYPTNPLDPGYAKKEAANILLRNNGEQQQQNVLDGQKEAQNSGGILGNLAAGAAAPLASILAAHPKLSDAVLSTLKASPFLSSDYKSQIGPSNIVDKQDVQDFNDRKGTAQSIGSALPSTAISAAASEYAIPKIALGVLGSKVGTKLGQKAVEVLSRVPGTLAEKVPTNLLKSIGEMAGRGLTYGAATAATDDAQKLASKNKVDLADNAIQLAAGPIAEIGTGSLGLMLKSLAPGALTRALGLIDSKLEGPGAVNPSEALDKGLVKGSFNPFGSSERKTKNALNDQLDLLSKKVTDKALASSEKIEPIPPPMPEAPKQLPNGMGDFYTNVPPPRLTGTQPAPEVTYTGYNTKSRPPVPSRPPEVIPITATPAQKAADDARILAENTASRGASMDEAKKAATERLAAQQSYSQKVLQDKADALLSKTKPQSDVTSAREIPEVGANPNSIPSTKTLAEKRAAAAKAESDRLTTNRQAEDDKLVNDALNKDDFLDNGKPNLKGQRGSADIGALKDLAGKAITDSRSLKDPFPTVPKIVNKAIDKITGRDKEVFTPTPLLSPGPGERLAPNHVVDVKGVVNDVKKTMEAAHSSPTGGEMDSKQLERAHEVLNNELEDATRQGFNSSTGKSTPASASGWLSRIDDKLKNHYKTMAKPGDVLDNPQEKVLLELQAKLREELGTKVPELRDLVKQQAERIPLRNEVSNVLDKNLLQKVGKFAMRGSLPVLAGSGVGYLMDGKKGAFEGGTLAAMGTHAVTSVGGAAALNALGKWGMGNSRARSIAEQLASTYITNKRDKGNK